MLRRTSSLIEDAKLVIQRNQASNGDRMMDLQSRTHEFLIICNNSSTKLSFAFVVKCIEACGATIKILEDKSPKEDNESNKPEGIMNSHEIYVNFKCSLSDLILIQDMICENGRFGMKRISTFGTKRNFRYDWFPKTAADLDSCQHLKEKLEGDPITEEHPGYQDLYYLERRRTIAQIALEYRHGKPIPRVEYSSLEKDTWKHVYTTLKPLHISGACRQYLKAMSELESCGLYKEDEIAQLEDVSNYLRSRTGFQLRPVAGLVSPRDFLASLAVKVFQCTQYMRHDRSPMHTPEPDCCHELIGHVPMLCDPEFARFSQEIGILSLGVRDEDILKLASLYWFTVEFGLCKEDGEIKAYGAGILSAYGEFQHALSGKPSLEEFDCAKASIQPYQDNDYQPIYFVASSFTDALVKMREYAQNFIEKPFIARYDSSTERIETYSKRDPLDIIRAAEKLKVQIDLIKDLLE